MLKQKVIGPNAFYSHLKAMEERRPKDYPPGCSDRYLQVVLNPASTERGSVYDTVLSSLDRGWIGFKEIRLRLEARGLETVSRASISGALSRLLSEGLIERRGSNPPYEYRLSGDSHAA